MEKNEITLAEIINHISENQKQGEDLKNCLEEVPNRAKSRSILRRAMERIGKPTIQAISFPEKNNDNSILIKLVRKKIKLAIPSQSPPKGQERLMVYGKTLSEIIRRNGFEDGLEKGKIISLTAVRHLLVKDKACGKYADSTGKTKVWADPKKLNEYKNYPARKSI